MSARDGLVRIEVYYEGFRAGLKRCRDAETFIMADWCDVYGRLGQLRDRYEIESKQKTLTPSQDRALRKVFEDDKFIEGLLTIRTIGEHVVKRDGAPVFYTSANAPIYITASASAMDVLSNKVVSLKDREGQSHNVNHLENFLEADRRIKKAIDRARPVHQK